VFALPLKHVALFSVLSAHGAPVITGVGDPEADLKRRLRGDSVSAIDVAIDKPVFAHVGTGEERDQSRGPKPRLKEKAERCVTSHR
jgi:hypothetical protein